MHTLVEIGPSNASKGSREERTQQFFFEEALIILDTMHLIFHMSTSHTTNDVIDR